MNEEKDEYKGLYYIKIINIMKMMNIILNMGLILNMKNYIKYYMTL